MSEEDDPMSFAVAKEQLKALKGAVDHWRRLAVDQRDAEGAASLAKSMAAIDVALEAMGLLEE
jgi:hypothetical protein